MVFQRDLLLFAVVLRAFFHVHRNWCGFYICIVCFVFVILLLLLLLVKRYICIAVFFPKF